MFIDRENNHSYHYNNENMHKIMKTVREDGTSVRDNDLCECIPIR